MLTVSQVNLLLSLERSTEKILDKVNVRTHNLWSLYMLTVYPENAPRPFAMLSPSNIQG